MRLSVLSSAEGTGSCPSDEISISYPHPAAALGIIPSLQYVKEFCSKEVIFMSKSKTEKRMTTKSLVILALLSAISIILSRFCVIYFTESLRLSFGNIPVIIAGIMFGPIGGAVMGGVTDVLGSTLMSGLGWYPPLTLTPILMGLIAGLLKQFVRKNTKFYKVLILTLAANGAGTMVWSTLSLSWLYGIPFMTQAVYRFPFYAGVAVLEAVIIFALIKSGAFKSQLFDKNLR